MRHIDFDPAKLEGKEKEWFDKWLARANAATELFDSIAPGAKPAFTSAIWSELKTWLLEHVFDGKCAYCETKYDASSFGAAEHYRPKGRVTERSNAGKLLPVAAHDVPHRGYYWLAYTWWNLVPSCDLCNSGKGAKADQFPISATRVFEKAELADPSAREELNVKEAPLLLNPYDDDPAEHLVFGEFGSVSARENSARGRATIEVCRLRREPLKVRRQERQEIATASLSLTFSNWVQSGFDERHLDKFRESFTAPSQEYSAAAEVILDKALEKFEEQMSRRARAG